MLFKKNNGYKIKIYIPGFDTIEEELDIEKLQKFVEIKKDFYVYSPTYVNKKDQKSVKSILDSLLGNITSVEAFKNDAVTKTNDVVQTTTMTVNSTSPCNGSVMPDFTALKGKSLNEPANYKKLLEIAENTCAEGMIFKVQIAAYRNPENYKYNHLSMFGKPEIINYPDGITRFTLLQFSTLKEAEKARQKIIGKGQADAWVTAFVSGKRYTLEELIMVDFLGKSVN